MNLDKSMRIDDAKSDGHEMHKIRGNVQQSANEMSALKFRIEALRRGVEKNKKTEAQITV